MSQVFILHTINTLFLFGGDDDWLLNKKSTKCVRNRLQQQSSEEKSSGLCFRTERQRLHLSFINTIVMLLAKLVSQSVSVGQGDGSDWLCLGVGCKR